MVNVGSKDGGDRRNLGATPFHVFRTVTLPALRNSIVVAASVVFIFFLLVH